MKVILKDSATGLYLGAFGFWVNNPDRAFEFEDEGRARMLAYMEHLNDAEVIRHEPTVPAKSYSPKNPVRSHAAKPCER